MDAEVVAPPIEATPAAARDEGGPSGVGRRVDGARVMPAELWERVLSLLEYRELCACACACRTLRRLGALPRRDTPRREISPSAPLTASRRVAAGTPSLWAALYARHYGAPPPRADLNLDLGGWLALFRERTARERERAAAARLRRRLRLQRRNVGGEGKAGAGAATEQGRRGRHRSYGSGTAE